MRFRPFAIPLIIAAICAAVAGAMSLSGTELGAGLGMAVGALAATSLIVFAARAKPEGHLEVAAAEPTPEAAQRVAELAGSAADVRLLVPVPSHRLDRWLSAEDKARHE